MHNWHNTHNHHNMNNQHNASDQHDEHNKYKHPISMSQVVEWHMPENVIDQINDVLVQEIFFLDKLIRGRATGTHTKRGLGTAQQDLKQIILTCLSRSRDFSSVGCQIGLSKHWTRKGHTTLSKT
jgi:hypothetical protein